MTDAKPPAPAPISWAPSQWWDGDDGEWSSFDLRVGTPEQTVRVLPSTAGSATWIIMPGGCEPLSSDCSNSRGGTFDQSRSSTWKDLGPFTLALEQNLGRNESGAFGLDTISLGLSNATGGPTLDSQIMAGIKTERWYTGVFGLQQQPMNLTDFAHPQQSFLSALHTRKLIPSLSWAYTAGARYQSKGSFGSLTFGGSDTSRYDPTDVSFNLAQDVARDLVVGIQSITLEYINGSTSNLLPSPTLAFVDSTVPYLYLPEEACNAFESELGLVYNKTDNLYFVNDTVRQTLSNLMPKFTFRLANDKVSEPAIDITLPYASFDLVAEPPLLPTVTPYFPLRRGNENQITLGRAFLQEAYIITDYDQGNFTIAQARFNETAKPKIVPIPWNATAVPHANNRLSRRATIGISTGSVAFVLLTSIFIIFFTLKWRRNRTTTALTDATQNFEDPSPLRPFSYISTQEIGHQSVQELHNTPYQIELLDRQAPSGSGVELNELPHDGGLSHRESSALVARNSADIFLRWDNRSANNTRDKENDISRLRVAQVPGTLNLPLDKAPSRTTPTKSDSLKSQGSMKGVQADSFPTHLMVDVHKALPHVPLTTAQSKRNHFSLRSSSATSISESIQTPPITYRAVRDAFAQRIHTVAASPRVSLIATYATIFDVEEYKDHAIVSETEFESF